MTQERKLTTADLAHGGRDDELPADDGPEELPVAETSAESGPVEPLFGADDADRYRDEWKAVQGEFVDQPREAVQMADSLVADLMQQLAKQFAETRAGLERQWEGNADVSTEELRVAMMRYRSFFERLLTV